MSEFMQIPRNSGEGPVLAVFYLFALTIVVLALTNLIFWRSTSVLNLIASALWPTILILSHWQMYRDEGSLGNYLVNRLEPFASEHFTELQFQQKGSPLLCFGYRFAGRARYLLKVRIKGVTQLNWSAGQASALRGEDMDDWSVVLWFQKEHVVHNTAPHYGLRIIGPCGQLATAKALGGQFLGFLSQSGLKFEPAEQQNSFVPV
jgi:hypothetical protein